MNKIELIRYIRQRLSRSRSILRLLQSNLLDDIYDRNNSSINNKIVSLVKAIDSNGLKELIRLQSPRAATFGLTHKQLLAMAKDLKIAGYSIMKKEELIFNIREWKRNNEISQICSS